MGKHIVYIILIVFFSTVNAQDSKGLSFEAAYVNDYAHNISGGLRTGQTDMGMIDFIIALNTEAAGLWKNGEFYFQLENTHGGTFSSTFVGDLQVASNIDNGDYTYLYMLWYKHTFNELEFTIGRHDLNSEFLCSDFAGEYLNSSFGIMPSASINVPVSIFPKTSLGAILKYNISEKITFATAIYDGDPLDLDSDRYGLSFHVRSKDGYLLIGEGQYNSDFFLGKSGTFKLGYYYHTSDFDNYDNPGKTINGNSGVYFIGDQVLSETSDSRYKSVFFNFGYAPENRNIVDMFIGGGLNIYGLFGKRVEDVAGLSIGFASISNSYIKNNPGMKDFETVIEGFYRFHLSEHFEIQPDIQYIINTGVSSELDNCLIGIMRFYINFSQEH